MPLTLVVIDPSHWINSVGRVETTGARHDRGGPVASRGSARPQARPLADLLARRGRGRGGPSTRSDTAFQFRAKSSPIANSAVGRKYRSRRRVVSSAYAAPSTR